MALLLLEDNMKDIVKFFVEYWWNQIYFGGKPKVKNSNYPDIKIS
jgi:hypothetical protein